MQNINSKPARTTKQANDIMPGRWNSTLKTVVIATGVNNWGLQEWFGQSC